MFEFSPQILLDSLHHFLRTVANQCAVGILGWFGSSGAFRGILIALFDRIECIVADHLGPLCVGFGQKTQAIRFEHDILGDQKLLATISLFIAIRLSNWWIRKLWYVTFIIARAVSDPDFSLAAPKSFHSDYFIKLPRGCQRKKKCGVKYVLLTKFSVHFDIELAVHSLRNFLFASLLRHSCGARNRQKFKLVSLQIIFKSSHAQSHVVVLQQCQCRELSSTSQRWMAGITHSHTRAHVVSMRKTVNHWPFVRVRFIHPHD